MSVGYVATGFALGAALLAFWAVARFPLRGPQTVRSATIATGVACLLLLLSGPVTEAAVAVAGRSLALLFVVLPTLTFGFWCGAHLVRVWVERLAPYRR